MEEIPLKTRLASFLKARYPDWYPSGELQRLTVIKTPYTGRTAVRRLQELMKEGILHVGYREHNHAWYRWNPDSENVRTLHPSNEKYGVEINGKAIKDSSQQELEIK